MAVFGGGEWIMKWILPTWFHPLSYFSSADNSSIIYDPLTAILSPVNSIRKRRATLCPAAAVIIIVILWLQSNAVCDQLPLSVLHDSVTLPLKPVDARGGEKMKTSVSHGYKYKKKCDFAIISWKQAPFKTLCYNIHMVLCFYVIIHYVLWSPVFILWFHITSGSSCFWL